jgi:hypothetical protein
MANFYAQNFILHKDGLEADKIAPLTLRGRLVDILDVVAG